MSKDPDVHSFKAIVDFVYSGHITLHVDTVQEIILYYINYKYIN